MALSTLINQPSHEYGQDERGQETWSQCVSTDMMASRLSGSDRLSREACSLVLETLAT